MSPDTTASNGPYELTLVKKGQRYVYRYRPGEEKVLLSHLVEAAQDPETDFDWFDAAVLSHQMGHRMHHQITQQTTD